MPPIPGPGGGLADGRYRDITSHGSRDTATISLDVMLRTLKLRGKNRLKFYFYHHHKASILDTTGGRKGEGLEVEGS